PLLSQVERKELLVERNRTETAYPANKSLQELFQEQVEKRRESVALVYGGEKLSYQAFKSRANQVAHFLREKGVGAEVRVGLCAERSLDMVVGMLGIIKAGGAYVPLDPSSPPERLSYMVQDAELKLLLTQEALQSQIGEQGIEVVCIKDIVGKAGSERTANPEVVSGAENLAKGEDTSGSHDKTN